MVSKAFDRSKNVPIDTVQVMLTIISIGSGNIETLLALSLGLF